MLQDADDQVPHKVSVEWWTMPIECNLEEDGVEGREGGTGVFCAGGRGVSGRRDVGRGGPRTRPDTLVGGS